MLFNRAILSLPFMISLAAAECWEHGAEADQGMGKSSVEYLAPMMQGWFADNQMRYACYSDYGSGNSYIYTVQRMAGKGGDWLDVKHINEWLYQEAANCRYGGHTDHDNAWTVNVNAVAGTCIDATYINGHPETLPLD